MAAQMAPEEHHHYGGTIAPLIVDNLVIVGVAGADEGIRGFVAAFKPDNGTLAWRHWTVPRRGEPGMETWKGAEPLTGGGSTWLTGSYDPSSDTLYWPTGNPWPDGNKARDRPGDNLYTDSVLALNAKTGDLKWYYQFTPHDVEDRDATEPNVLADVDYRGKPSKLLLHADRNGFFYVLDRTDGKLLLAKPFVRRLDWASGIGADGRPVVIESPRLSRAMQPIGTPLRSLAGDAPLPIFWRSRNAPAAPRAIPIRDRSQAIPARRQHRYRREISWEVSAAWTRTRQNVVRRSRDRWRRGLLWATKWRVFGGGSAQR